MLNFIDYEVDDEFVFIFSKAQYVLNFVVAFAWTTVVPLNVWRTNADQTHVVDLSTSKAEATTY